MNDPRSLGLGQRPSEQREHIYRSQMDNVLLGNALIVRLRSNPKNNQATFEGTGS